MSSISFLTSAYERFPVEITKDPVKTVTKALFNYAELTWSSTWTHGVSMVHVQDGQSFPAPRGNGSLIQTVTQLANWLILGALLTVRLTYAVPLLAVSLAAKLYHFSTMKALDKEFPVPKPLEDFVSKSAETHYQFAVNTEDLNARMQKTGGDETPKITKLDLEGLIKEYPDSANKISKDGRQVQGLILASFERGLPILKGKPVLNEEFTLSLKIALEGIMGEKKPEKRAKLFDDLCAAFQGCQPDQHRFVTSLAGQYRAVGGTIENFLFEKLKSYLSHTLEQVIGELHGDVISSELMAKPHLQMPHIISQYLVKFAEAGLYLPGYKIAAHDHILRGAYGGVPPYDSKGLERFHNLVHQGFLPFLDQVALEINEGGEVITKWLFDFSRRDEDLKSFGYYKEQLRSQGWYQHMKPATEDQEATIHPYISRWEVVYLMETFGLTQHAVGLSSFKLTL